MCGEYSSEAAPCKGRGLAGRDLRLNFCQSVAKKRHNCWLFQPSPRLRHIRRFKTSAAYKPPFLSMCEQPSTALLKKAHRRRSPDIQRLASRFNRNEIAGIRHRKRPIRQPRPFGPHHPDRRRFFPSGRPKEIPTAACIRRKSFAGKKRIQLFGQHVFVNDGRKNAPPYRPAAPSATKDRPNPAPLQYNEYRPQEPYGRVYRRFPRPARRQGKAHLH